MRCCTGRNAATCAWPPARSRPARRSQRGSGDNVALLPFAAISLCYFGFAGLFGTYAPLWYQSLGYSTFAIGALTSMQSGTRLFAPYAWGWSADHSGRREFLLRLAIGGALAGSL